MYDLLSCEKMRKLHKLMVSLNSNWHEYTSSQELQYWHQRGESLLTKIFSVVKYLFRFNFIYLKYRVPILTQILVAKTVC